MEDFLLHWTPWIKSDNLIEFKKSLMKALFAIYFGPTLMTDKVGESLLVVQDTPLVRIFLSSSIRLMV